MRRRPARRPPGGGGGREQCAGDNAGGSRSAWELRRRAVPAAAIVAALLVLSLMDSATATDLVTTQAETTPLSAITPVRSTTSVSTTTTSVVPSSFTFSTITHTTSTPSTFTPPPTTILHLPSSTNTVPPSPSTSSHKPTTFSTPLSITISTPVPTLHPPPRLVTAGRRPRAEPAHVMAAPAAVVAVAAAPPPPAAAAPASGVVLAAPPALAAAATGTAVDAGFPPVGHTAVDEALAGVSETPLPASFGTENSTVVVAQLGGNAFLPCIIYNIGDGVVSWIRRKDYHLLTVGVTTYTRDARYEMVHAQHSEEWTLQIKYVQDRDAGLYECQVSSHPPMSNFIELRVVEARAEIAGSAEKYLKVGSSLRLECALRQSTAPLLYIFWYHNNRMINYDSGVNVTTDKEAKTSTLHIGGAARADSGNYSCVPNNAQPASTYVHILNAGENPAAMQHGLRGLAWLRCPSSWLLLACLLLSVSGGLGGGGGSDVRRSRAPRRRHMDAEP